MVITMAVLVGAVAVLLLLVPAPQEVRQPGVDPAEAAPAASEQLGFDVLAVPPERIGEGWSASYARVEQAAESAAGAATASRWRVGYLSPGRRRVDLSQAARAELLVDTGEDVPDVPAPGEGPGVSADGRVAVLRGDDGSVVLLRVSGPEGAADLAAVLSVLAGA